jgi:hypothetical protein
MTSRLDDDDLDIRWRDGLQASVPFVDGRNAPERVAARVTRRRRRRRTGTALIAATITILLAAGGAVLLTRGDTQPSIRTVGRTPDSRAATGPITQLHVTSEANLTMHLDRATVPAGVVEIFYLDDGGTHELRIDRVPNFRLLVPGGPTVGRVRLAPGRYVLYCDIPSHRQAGEQAILTVKPSEPARPATHQSSTADTWAQIVGPYLPSGATLLPLPPPASTVLGADISNFLTYKLPSGRYLVAARQRGTVDPTRANVVPGKDIDDRTAQGSRRFVITHNAAVWQQVIIQRLSGTMINLQIENNPAVTYTTPPELNIEELVALSDALDNTGSDLP